MKTIQKITLALLTMVSVSSLSAAVLDINFADGAELAGNVTGAVKFIGSAASDNLTLSGSVGDADLNVGNIIIADPALFTGTVSMTGANLEADAAITSATLPSLIMSSPATIKAGADVVVATTSGTGALTLDGIGEVTLATVASTGGLAAVAVGQKVRLNNGSVLAAATYNVEDLDIEADAALGGNFASVFATGAVDSTAGDVAAGSFTSLQIAAATGSLDIGINKWSQDVTVA